MPSEAINAVVTLLDCWDNLVALPLLPLHRTQENALAVLRINSMLIPVGFYSPTLWLAFAKMKCNRVTLARRHSRMGKLARPSSHERYSQAATDIHHMSLLPAVADGFSYAR